jgi:hypothetical protein
MGKQLDELSKDLAGGMSRRAAFWRFFAGLGGLLFVGRKASADGNGNDVCVDFCRFQGLTGSEFGQCVAASAHCPPGECALAANSGQHLCVPIDTPCRPIGPGTNCV